MFFFFCRLQSENHLFVQAADDFLRSQNQTDAAIIFSDQVGGRRAGKPKNGLDEGCGLAADLIKVVVVDHQGPALT